MQGFPSDFYFEGPFDDKYKQIGNAVSPIFSTRLAAHVLTLLAGKNHAETEEVVENPTFGSYSGAIARAKMQKPVKENDKDAE